MSASKFQRALLVAATLAFPAAAIAQTANPTPGTSPAATGAPAPAVQTTPSGGHAANQAQSGRLQRGVEDRIADLHRRLNITPAQEQTWNQFAQVMRDNAANMDQTYEQRAEKVQQMNAVDNMQSYAQLAEAHAQDVQKLVPAFQSVYDSLSPEQKRTADQLFRNYAERSERRAGTHRG